MSGPVDVLAEARAFMRSRVVLTAAELDLFTWLDGRTTGAEEIARGLGVDRRAVTRLLDVLVTLGLLGKSGGYYANTAAGSLLSGRHPETVRPSVLHLQHLWGMWSHLTETVRRGENPHRQPAVAGGIERLRAFIGAMEVGARERARALARAYGLERFHGLLDVGGGPGSYTIAFLEQNPRLRAVLFDLADVIPLAEERIRQAGLIDRVQLESGDFYRDELPTGCDVALLSAIIHQNDRQENLELFRKVHRALLPGGTLLIRDHVMDEDRTHPPAGALFAINMLVNTRGGDTYTFAEVKEGLAAAGFTGIALVRQGENMDCLVEAGKPGSGGARERGRPAKALGG